MTHTTTLLRNVKSNGQWFSKSCLLCSLEKSFRIMPVLLSPSKITMTLLALIYSSPQTFISVTNTIIQPSTYLKTQKPFLIFLSLMSTFKSLANSTGCNLLCPKSVNFYLYGYYHSPNNLAPSSHAVFAPMLALLNLILHTAIINVKTLSQIISILSLKFSNDLKSLPQPIRPWMS